MNFMAQMSAAEVQTIEPNQKVIFTSSFVSPQPVGIVFPDADGTGLFLRGLYSRRYSSCGMRDFFTDFYASFSANIKIPTGGTVSPISMAITLNGDPIQTGIMIESPSAVDSFENISAQVFVPVPKGSTAFLTVENTSDQAIQIQNANLIVDRIG